MTNEHFQPTPLPENTHLIVLWDDDERSYEGDPDHDVFEHHVAYAFEYLGVHKNWDDFHYVTDQCGVPGEWRRDCHVAVRVANFKDRDEWIYRSKWYINRQKVVEAMWEAARTVAHLEQGGK